MVNPKRIVINSLGETEMDPLKAHHKVKTWLSKVKSQDGDINYLHYADKMSSEASRQIIRLIFDLMEGRNLAKGSPKGARQMTTISSYLTRLPLTIERLEAFCKRTLFQLTEDDVFKFFGSMRDGTLKTGQGLPYKDVQSYVKIFCSFWNWNVRTQRKEGKILPNIVEYLNITNAQKPKWVYFTLKDVEKMCDYAPNMYYKALALFLFDSGIRAPKEMSNVKVSDLTPTPDGNHYFLQIREETSKTFGRKIKLMICSDALKKYLAIAGKSPDDFVFDLDYAASTQMLKKMAFKACGFGKVSITRFNQRRITGGISMYDFRHCSVCHYLPVYKSENQIKYRYGWAKADMIHYYSEFIGMRDTLSEDDLFVNPQNKMQMQVDLEREKQKVVYLQERMDSQRIEFEDRMKKLEAMMIQRITDNAQPKSA
jgi:DNA-binding ferritin-like protein (Dps family)